MADREKAIRGMETHYSEHPCSQCPYRGEERCTMELAADALALLKEQEKQLKEWEKYAPYLAAHGILKGDEDNA